MEKPKSFVKILADLMIKDVPAYANKLYYSLGFLSMIAFLVLILTGVVMIFYGPNWWLTSSVGVYFRSVHLWATQAFIVFVILHLIIVFLTSGFKSPRRLTWVFGALMFCFLMVEGEFGYVLRGDFSSQYRSLQGADLYNGSGIGAVINNLNYRQIYGIHIVLIPLIIVGLLFLHYLLIRVRGIAKPYRKDVVAKTVPANHVVLFLRGFVLIVVILILGKVFPSPFLKPTTIQEIAQTDSSLMGTTLVAELTSSSDTATYTDNISPYTFNTKSVYIVQPYDEYLQTVRSPNLFNNFETENATEQQSQINSATKYFSSQSAKLNIHSLNPIISVISSLIMMGQSGLYDSDLSLANPTGDATTYTTRFLSDTGVLDNKAQALGMTTDQYGMLRDEPSKHFAPGAWWLAPLGLMDHTILATDANQDRDGAIIIGVFMLLLVAFPYIPFVNQIPDKIKLYKIIWR